MTPAPMNVVTGSLSPGNLVFRLLAVCFIACAASVCAEPVAPAPSASLSDAGGINDFTLLEGALEPGLGTKCDWRIKDGVLLVSVVCMEPQMDKLKASNKVDNSMAVFNDDSVGVFVSPTGSPAEYYHFEVSAAGARFQEYRIESGNTTGGEYGGIWEAEVVRGTDRWTAEFRIPLRSFYLTGTSDFSKNWLLNVARTRKAGRYALFSWSPLKEHTFHDSASFRSVPAEWGKAPHGDIVVGSASVISSVKSGEGYLADLQLKTMNFGGESKTLQVAVDDGGTAVSKQEVTFTPGTGVAVLKSVPFSGEGSRSLGFRVNDANGALMHERRIGLNFTHRTMQVHFTVPFYNDAFYPGQEVTDARGTVQVGTGVTPGERKLVITRIHPEGEPWSLSLRVQGENVPFALPAATLKQGRNAFRFSLQQGGKTIGETEADVNVLSPPPAGNVVFLDENLNLVVNGRKLFVLGFYADAESGFGLSQALKQKYGKKSTSLFVNAQGAWISIEAGRLTKDGKLLNPRPRLTEDVVPDDHVFAAMLEVIKANAGNPKKLFYYLEDEPECRGVSPVYLKHLYRFIKRNDPYHPVLIVSREPERFVECADILAPHPYASTTLDADGKRRMKPMGDIVTQMKAVRHAGENRIAPWIMPQTFSYGFRLANAVHPTFEEFRCTAFAAIASGARGLIPFIYAGALEILDLRLGYDFVYEEIDRLSPFLLQPFPGLPVDVKVAPPLSGKSVAASLIEKEGVAVLMLVNLEEVSLEADVTLPEKYASSAWHGFRGSEVPETKASVMHVSLAPFEARILSSSPALGEGLRTLTQFDGELQAAKKALVNPLNILPGEKSNAVWSVSSMYYFLGGNVTSLGSLADGVKDALGYTPAKGPAGEKAQWISIGFRKATVPVKTVRIYGSGIAGVTLGVMHDGVWTKLPSQPWVAGAESCDIPLPEAVPLDKIKMTFETVPGARIEVYEVEILRENP